VDFCIQYLSPRQVSTLIQRVGRAGHKLNHKSEGVTIAAYGEDALESLVTSVKAREKHLEPTVIHMEPLDVLTHQLVGLTLFEDDGIEVRDAFELVVRAYPFKELAWDEFNDLVRFLHTIGLIKKLGEDMKRTGKGRKYYYENLGMINDERRYPFIRETISLHQCNNRRGHRYRRRRVLEPQSTAWS